MPNKNSKLHQIFSDTFTLDELNDICDNATVVTQITIMLSTKDNFFELSADGSDKLNIYCNNNHDSTEKQLTKDEFMKLYKESSLVDIHIINVDE